MILNSSEAVDGFGHSESNRFERFHGAPSSAKIGDGGTCEETNALGPADDRHAWGRTD